MAEKRHKATPKHLRDARKQGEVVFSADLASTAVFWLVLIMAWLFAPRVLAMLQELWLHATSGELLTRPDDHLGALATHTASVLLWVCIPLAAIAAVGGILGSFFQVGGLAAWSRLKPDVNRLNPATGLKNMFSMRSLVKLLKLVIKSALLVALLYVVIRSYLGDALRLGYLQADGILAFGAHALLVTFAWAGLVYGASAAFDYTHERYEFMKKQRMSTEEIRRERKESEGDPINQSRRRSAYFEAIYASIGDRVRVSSAVIHSQRVAIALQYLGEHDLPRVIARGEGDVAERIRRFAAEAMIPVEIDADLAERIYEQVPVDQPVPQALYARVARLLRWAQGEDVGPVGEP
jgi:type III secretion protein U